MIGGIQYNLKEELSLFRCNQGVFIYQFDNGKQGLARVAVAGGQIMIVLIGTLYVS